MLFVSTGYEVCLYDILEEQLSIARKDIKSQLKILQESNLLRGNLSATEQYSLISGKCYLHYFIPGRIIFGLSYKRPIKNFRCYWFGGMLERCHLRSGVCQWKAWVEETSLPGDRFKSWLEDNHRQFNIYSGTFFIFKWFEMQKESPCRTSSKFQDKI
jgi:hypothetical protein